MDFAFFNSFSLEECFQVTENACKKIINKNTPTITFEQFDQQKINSLCYSLQCIFLQAVNDRNTESIENMLALQLFQTHLLVVKETFAQYQPQIVQALRTCNIGLKNEVVGINHQIYVPLSFTNSEIPFPVQLMSEINDRDVFYSIDSKNPIGQLQLECDERCKIDLSKQDCAKLFQVLEEIQGKIDQLA